MSDSNQGPRRNILPIMKVPNGSVVNVDRVSNISNSLDRAFGIVDEQLMKIALKSRQAGGVLDDKETKALHGHIKALVELSKEEREREKSNKDAAGLESMTNAELLELAKAQLQTAKDANDKG
jgi:hypothetical protein